MDLTLDGLVVARDARTFTAPVSLRIPAGTMLAITGSNGSGKSTLMDQLAGLLPSASCIAYGGLPIESMSLAQRSHTLAYVEQSWTSYFDVPVETAVTWGIRPHGNRDAVAEALRACGCEQLAHQRLSTLSGGERARVALARAHAQRTPALLLDEPTAAVDRSGREAIADVLVTWARAGRTVVVVTHDAALITRADQVLDLDSVAPS